MEGPWGKKQLSCSGVARKPVWLRDEQARVDQDGFEDVADGLMGLLGHNKEFGHYGQGSRKSFKWRRDTIQAAFSQGPSGYWGWEVKVGRFVRGAVRSSRGGTVVTPDRLVTVDERD